MSHQQNKKKMIHVLLSTYPRFNDNFYCTLKYIYNISRDKNEIKVRYIGKYITHVYSLQKIWTHGFHAAEDWTGRYFCLRQYLGFQIGLTDPKSWPLQLLYHTIIYGIPRSSHTFSAPLFFPAEIQQKEGFSFMAMPAKELSTYSLALPKDVCPWWVYRKRIYAYLCT